MQRIPSDITNSVRQPFDKYLLSAHSVPWEYRGG